MNGARHKVGTVQTASLVAKVNGPMDVDDGKALNAGQILVHLELLEKDCDSFKTQCEQICQRHRGQRFKD